jgi:FkbM family methyltransferase
MTILTLGGGSQWFKYWKPRNGQIIVDVGSAVGQVSGAIMERWNKNVKIIAIDPHPRSWPLYEARLSKYKQNYILVKKGVSDHKEIKTLISQDEQVKLPDGSQYYTAQWPEVGDKWNNLSEADKKHFLSWEVELDTLDNILDDLGIKMVDYIKMDTRGMEEKVLRGFTKYKKGTIFHIEWDHNLDKILYELMLKKINIVEINFDHYEKGILGAVFARA